MQQLLKPITDKLNQIMWTLIINGLVLVILAALITWNIFILQLVLGLMVLIVAFSFFYGAHKLHAIKKLIKKF